MALAQRRPVLQDRDWELTLNPLLYCYTLTTPAIEAKRRGVSKSVAKKRLNKLVARRVLVRLSAWVSEIPQINGPLLEWYPGDGIPQDLGSTAYHIRQRWDYRPERKQTVYTASRRLLAWKGLPPRKPLRLDSGTHELGCVAVYEYCQEQYPDLTYLGAQMFEETRGLGEKVEDGQLIRGDEIVYLVDWLGSYRKSRLIELVLHAQEMGVPLLGF